MAGRLSRVGVVGSGTDGHPRRARPLGTALAELPVHLITGGGAGVMEEVARGFTAVTDRRGLSVGVLPARAEGDASPVPPPGYPNAWVELPIATHLADRGERGRELGSRNHVVVLTSDVLVALPGSDGTRTEVELALKYARPVVAHLQHREEVPGLPAAVTLAPTLEEVLEFVREHLGLRAG